MSRYDTLARQRKMELALVDLPSGLTPWEQNFCIEYCLTGSVVEAVRRTRFDGDGKTEVSLRATGNQVLRRPVAKRYIQSIMSRLEAMGVMTLLDAQMFLTDAIRTPIGEITADDPLCQKRTITTRTNKDGSQITTEQIESVSKLGALKALADLQGWNAPQKLEVNHGGNIMIVPMTACDEDWEKAARDSQQKLMQDAIDI